MNNSFASNIFNNNKTIKTQYQKKLNFKKIFKKDIKKNLNFPFFGRVNSNYYKFYKKQLIIKREDIFDIVQWKLLNKKIKKYGIKFC